MVGCVSSRGLGLVLLVLLHPALGVDNLQTIINHLQGKYGVDAQYALGINVDAKYCRQGAVLDRHFLAWDYDAIRVKDSMNRDDRVYRGNRMIGARPKPTSDKRGKKYNYHSEYLLLIRSMNKALEYADPLMEKLLIKDRKGCAVFFTVNSPCVQTCSTPEDQNHPYSIIPALKMFSNHNGPKAFVFRQVWHHDVGKRDWENNIAVINQIVPVYRCNNNGCVRCINQNGVVDSRCK